ncbi:hypothetical protein DUI87_18526 [Hirundo rustica rustica]|uniref:Phosphatidylinositol-3-phosphatase SAC1 n=1 Tax=Hirundo rustica rustica TaxID=333673 RepID=A0A3M0KDV8_HIRRU|nr:hypothetical protein DUI87_18526 [Hirundo rustica rustica]
MATAAAAGTTAAAAYASLKLHITPEKFYVEACDDGADDVLAIDRVSTEVTLTVKKDVPPSAVTKPIFGILGTIRLVAGTYLLVITKKKKVGEIFSHAIWKATDFDILSYKKTMLHLTDIQLQDNKVFLSMLNHVLSVDGFYFSTTYDLTHTLQRLANTSPEFQEMSLLERIHRFATPVMHGCIDSEGHAANFVETEQIVHYKGSKASFVQMDGFQRHFDSQIISYGKQVIVNLVNQKGSEKPLEQTFSKMVNSMANGMVRYVAFDFHKECSRMRWDRLQILMDQLADQQDEFRTGKRTQWGLIMDGWNSLIRYYKNNFSDGFRQDAIDLFLGNYSVDEVEPASPLHVKKDWKFLALPIIMVVAFSMCIICLLMAGDTWTETLAYVLFWGSASFGTFAIILYNGKDFVDAPKLVQKEKMD